jgi:hypothetical protein
MHFIFPSRGYGRGFAPLPQAKVGESPAAQPSGSIHEHARAHGDLGVDQLDSIAITGNDAFEPVIQLAGVRRSRILISMAVSAVSGGASGEARPLIVIQKTGQLRMQKTASRFTSLSAVRSLTSSALQPDFMIL